MATVFPVNVAVSPSAYTRPVPEATDAMRLVDDPPRHFVRLARLVEDVDGDAVRSGSEIDRRGEGTIRPGTNVRDLLDRGLDEDRDLSRDDGTALHDVLRVMGDR